MNIIPEKAVLHISMRAPTDAEKETLKAKVVEIYKAAAKATGCEVRLEIFTTTDIYVTHDNYIVLIFIIMYLY